MKTPGKEKKGLAVLKKALTVLLVIVLLLAGGIGLYAYDNLTWQDRLLDHVWLAGYQEKQVTLPNGTLLNYGEGGAENATPLFLLHGQQVAWEDYARVLPDLAKRYHVYAVDCHGHGDSSHDPARYTCQRMTEDFIWFLQNVVNKPALLSGHSSGGVLATAIAAQAPELALGLLIEDAPFYCFRPEEMKARNAFVWSGGFQLTDAFLHQTEESDYIAYYFQHNPIFALFGKDFPTFAANAAREYNQAHPQGPFKMWFLPYSITSALYFTHQYDLAFGEAFYLDTWFQGLDQDELLRAVECPTVYLHAKTSYMMDGIMTCANTQADAERVASLIPHCVKIELPASDHDIHFVYPDQFLNGLDRLDQMITQ